MRENIISFKSYSPSNEKKSKMKLLPIIVYLVTLKRVKSPVIYFQKEADVGIIEKVSLRNFMCHYRLDVNFGPNVNFIVGHNGSKTSLQ